MKAVEQWHKELHSLEGGRGNPNETTWGTEISGKWTELPQKPPPAVLHPGALTRAK